MIDKRTKLLYTEYIKHIRRLNMGNEIVKYSNKMNEIPLNGFNKLDLNFFYTLCQGKGQGYGRYRSDF
jgi:hypothetical protein